MKNKNFIIVTVIFTLIIVSEILFFRGAKYNEAEIKMPDIPKSIGEWSLVEIPPFQDFEELLAAKNFITRNYTNSNNETVTLYLFCSKDYRRISQPNPPEIFLQSNIASITDKSILRLEDKTEVTLLVISHDLFSEIAIYWYSIGGEDINNYFGQQLKIIKSKILGKRITSALIILSTKIENNDRKASLQRLVAFTLLVHPIIDKYVP